MIYVTGAGVKRLALDVAMTCAIMHADSSALQQQAPAEPGKRLLRPTAAITKRAADLAGSYPELGPAAYVKRLQFFRAVRHLKLGTSPGSALECLHLHMLKSPCRAAQDTGSLGLLGLQTFNPYCAGCLWAHARLMMHLLPDRWSVLVCQPSGHMT